MVQVAKHALMGFVAVALLASLVGAYAPDARAAPDKSPYVGEWMTQDNDGSNLRLTIHGGSRPSSVKIADDLASSCPSGSAATGMGKGTLDAVGRLTVVFRVRCEVDGSVITISRTFDHLPSSDTLWEGSPVFLTWTRAG